MTDLLLSPESKEIIGAGFWIRVGARIVDILFVFALAFVAGLSAGICLALLARSGSLSPDWQARLRGFSFLAFICNLLGSFCYQTITEGLYGASLGKIIFQLRVVTEDSRPITMVQAFKRNLAYYWDALFFGLIGYSKMKQSDRHQRYGDVWAHTLVLRLEDVPASARSGFEIFVLGLLMGSVACIACYALGIVVRVF